MAFVEKMSSKAVLMLYLTFETITSKFAISQ